MSDILTNLWSDYASGWLVAGSYGAFGKGSALIVYLDGHMGEVRKEDIAQIDDNGGGDNAFWKGQN